MKTSEMIAMLEKNPKLKFRRKGAQRIVTANGDSSVYSVSLDLISQHVSLISLTDDWELVGEPVTWPEAIKAWLKGKTIRCVTSSGDYIYTNANNSATRLQDQSGSPPIAGNFLWGTWYIEEMEATV